MRKFFIAGNWKMNPSGSPDELLNGLKDKIGGMKKIDRLVAPPYIQIPRAKEILEGTGIHIAGQNL